MDEPVQHDVLDTPQVPKDHSTKLEAIEHIMDKKHQASLKAKAKEATAASAIAKGSSKKHPASGNSGEQVPKKAKPTKFCQHCKNKGSPLLTHNAKECCRYNKSSNLIAAAALKPTDAKKPFKKGGNKQMACLTATFELLMKKGLKKAKKSKKRKRNRAYDLSSSSNSNFE
jgi:hypothetical protein